jgi:hypothetical protein
VIFVCFVVNSSEAQTTAPTTQPFEIVGHIDSPAIPESSGIVESRKHPGVFWTHNDSGNPPAIFAIDRTGKLLGMFAVNAPNVDWEDIAIDDGGFLYLADIGNNNRNRNEVQIYRVAEPDPVAKGVAPLAVDRTWRLTFPNAQPFDAESLVLLGDNAYIIAKYRDGTQPGVYEFNLKVATDPQELKRVGTLSLRSPVTAADISRDGQQLAVMTVTGPNVYQINGDLHTVPPSPIASFLFIDAAIEAVTFTNGGLLATTEGRRVIFFPLPAHPTTHPTSQPAN